MLPGYIIQNRENKDRRKIVKTLQKQTAATLFDALMLPDGVDGCRKSHIEVAKLAKEAYPTSRYMIFEDDCILDKDWKNALFYNTYKNENDEEEQVDIVYIGYNDICEHTVFGTHALIMSPKARDILIKEGEMAGKQVHTKGAIDHILSFLTVNHNLKICLLNYAHQQKGLRSQITGKIRN